MSAAPIEQMPIEQMPIEHMPHSPRPRVSPCADHTWELRDVQYEDALTTSCFECVECGAVRYR